MRQDTSDSDPITLCVATLSRSRARRTHTCIVIHESQRLVVLCDRFVRIVLDVVALVDWHAEPHFVGLQGLNDALIFLPMAKSCLVSKCVCALAFVQFTTDVESVGQGEGGKGWMNNGPGTRRLQCTRV